MILSHRRLGLTVGLLSGALVGLMAVQGLLLRGAWQQKEQAFARNVRAALAQTVQQMEVGEIAGKAHQMFFGVAEGDTAVAVVHQMQTDAADSIVVVYAQDTVGKPENDRAFTSNFTLTVEGDRARLIKQVVGELVQLQPPPLAQRLALTNVDSLLTAQLLATGIDLQPRYAVLTAEDDSLAAFGPAGAELQASPFRARLFPLDLAPPRYDLVLDFPQQEAFLLRQLAPLLVASLVLMTVIIAGFVSTLRTLAEQRRFARQVVDFVNNMTHEFKTPLSTVSLASEAISRGPEPEAVHRFNRMIREETDRMGRQVEKILQVARLEGGDFELAQVPLDGNALVDSVCRAFSLQVQERRGRLDCRLTGEATPLLGDPHHLESVLNNLLDNALKYSRQAPEIQVETAVQGEQLVITVADRGVGVPRSDLERVFEPYYRCPTGNRHDVKGHGLGLSTVRLLVEAHGGRVTMKENPGGDALARVRFPLSRQEERA